MPPTPRSEEILRKQKNARTKKVLLLLVPVLLVAVGIQAPRVMKHFDKAKDQTAAVQEQVVEGYEDLAPTVPATTTSTPGAPADPAQLVAAGSAGLEDTDALPVAEEGELIVFTRFSAKDPFVQLVEEETEESTSASETSASDSGTTDTSSSSSSSSSTSSDTSTDTGTSTGTGSDLVTTRITISVNSVVEVVEVGDTFPENDPAFKLVAIDGGVAKIGLASGTFSNGQETIDLEPGDSVTLISQPDGARFTLELVEIG